MASNGVTANGLAEAPLIVAASHEIKTKYLGRMTEEPLVASYAVVSDHNHCLEADVQRRSLEPVPTLLVSRQRLSRPVTNGLSTAPRCGTYAGACYLEGSLLVADNFTGCKHADSLW